MRILVACECSGRVRDALRARGHAAYSCDLKGSPDNSQHHIRGDAVEVAHGIIPGRADRWTWDAIVAHPPCTYLTNSAAWAFKDGPYHQRCRPGTLLGAARRAAREDAVRFFMALWNAPIARKIFENPVGYMNTHWRQPDQIIQPWQFGDDASKATCLWLQNVPPLVIDPARAVAPRYVCQDCGRTTRGSCGQCESCGSMRVRERWANQTDSGQNRLSPGDTRAAERSVTYQGIANAIADALEASR
jgi:hypothetical protein